MAYLNDNYLKLKAGYLFPEIGRRVNPILREKPRSGQAPHPLRHRRRDRTAAACGHRGDAQGRR